MDNTIPRVIIALPVYNGERFLGETIESILNQTFHDFELYIFDNASTDSTPDICKEYLQKDGRIHYFRQPVNIGAAKNYNFAFHHVPKSELFKWAAADDLLKPDYLKRCVEILDQYPDVVIAYPKTEFIDEDGNDYEDYDPGWHLMMEERHERFRYTMMHGHWCNVIFGVIRRGALEKTKLIGDYIGQDYRLLGELSLMGKFYEVPEPLFLRRVHSQASSQNPVLGWQKKFYLGKEGGPIPLSLTRRMYEQFVTFMTSDLTMGEKISLLGSFLKRIYQKRSRLIREITLVAKSYFLKKDDVLSYDLRKEAFSKSDS